ncbi:MAG: hypothetical protein ABFS14_11990 [Gemmatimonadota bacterium]
MLRKTAVTKLGILALLAASPAQAQEGTYDLWLCFERCDETNRESLAYTVAELILSEAPLNLDSVPPEQLAALDLADPGTPTAANGCIITHIEAGRVFRPESDVFSLVEWTLTGDSEVTVEAPQEPFPYSIALSVSDGIEGGGKSRDRAVFVSGAARVPGDGIRCDEVAGMVQLQ